MKLKIVAFGIAKDILNTRESTIDINGNQLSTVRAKLYEEFPKLEALKSLQFAVNESYQPDDFILREHDEVIIIPPVSGG